MNEHTEVLIRELAGKMGTTVEYLWEVLVRQAYLVGFMNIVVSLIMVAAIYGGWQLLKKTKEWKDSAAREGLYVLWGVLSGLLSLLIMVLLFEAAGALINPEYWALMQVLPK